MHFVIDRKQPANSPIVKRRTDVIGTPGLACHFQRTRTHERIANDPGPCFEIALRRARKSDWIFTFATNPSNEAMDPVKLERVRNDDDVRAGNRRTTSQASAPKQEVGHEGY
jgi:hypothetical protein